MYDRMEYDKKKHAQKEIHDVDWMEKNGIRLVAP